MHLKTQDKNMSNLTIQQAVAEKIKTSGPNVEEKVIDLLTSREVTRRVDLVIKATAEIDKQEKELKKLDRPDVKVHPVGGGAPIESYSDAAFQKVKSAREKLEKLIKVTDTALDSNTLDAYNNLENALK